ncbi:hypothetical protein [Sphingomonas sp.]|jgi:hypothetical protein|uniref:hypothetical protein n=1 Tax=Sphingomonas sp. TaxID=28214 RepID=UPI002ED9C217
MTIALRLLAIFAFWLATALPAQAAVTITFWSHELGNSFPHAFFTLRGVPDAGGEPVDASYGFTAKSISPAILLGPVAGKVEGVTPAYMASSTAQFSVELPDARYVDILTLISRWSASGEDGRYRLNAHNCVHFVREAARLAGLAEVDRPKLMKRPRSYLQAIGAANAARVTIIDKPGRDHLPTLAALAPASPHGPAR